MIYEKVSLSGNIAAKRDYAPPPLHNKPKLLLPA